MPISAPYDITDPRRFFAEPASPRQRQYEALRAFYLEGLTSAQAAERFGYSPGAFRVLCHAFRRGALPEFFATTRPGPRDQPRKSAAQEQIIALRKRNYSIYDISRALKQQGTPLSATAVREVLATQGFAPLPRRLDEERPVLVGPSTEAVADVRSFTLAPREFTTRMGGLFLFVPDLVHVELEALALGAKLPGSRMIPAAYALRAALALKLWAIERKSHVMALVADEGLGTVLRSQCRCRRRASCPSILRMITPRKDARLLGLWHEQLTGEALLAGHSFNLDFHSVPYFGEHPVVRIALSGHAQSPPAQRAHLPRPGCRQPRVLLRQRRSPQGRGGDEIFRFIDFWNAHARRPAARTWSSTPSSRPTTVSTRLDQAGNHLHHACDAARQAS